MQPSLLAVARIGETLVQDPDRTLVRRAVSGFMGGKIADSIPAPAPEAVRLSPCRVDVPPALAGWTPLGPGLFGAPREP